MLNWLWIGVPYYITCLRKFKIVETSSGDKIYSSSEWVQYNMISIMCVHDYLIDSHLYCILLLQIQSCDNEMHVGVFILCWLLLLYHALYIHVSFMCYTLCWKLIGNQNLKSPYDLQAAEVIMRVGTSLIHM